MSHSYRHTPIVGITTARSEALDKQWSSRRRRRHVKQALQTVAAAEDEIVQEKTHSRSGTWTFAKDGKHWVSKARPELFRK